MAPNFDIVAASKVSNSRGEADFSGTGFIFNPQPDVLVLKFLWNKICMKPAPVPDVIKQILLKSDDLAPDATQIPEELFRHGPRRRSAYFYIFSPKLGPEVKERVTSNGNWNDFVSGEPVLHQFGRGTMNVGSVRVMQYSLNNSDSGPHYYMREYRLNPSLIPAAMRYSFINMMVERVVVCEIEKTNNAPDPSHTPRGGGRLTIVDGEEAIGGLNHLLGSAGVGIIY